MDENGSKCEEMDKMNKKKDGKIKKMLNVDENALFFTFGQNSEIWLKF